MDACCEHHLRPFDIDAAVPIVLLVCDSCGSRTWQIDGQAVSPELALKFAKLLDGTD